MNARDPAEFFYDEVQSTHFVDQITTIFATATEKELASSPYFRTIDSVIWLEAGTRPIQFFVGLLSFGLVTLAISVALFRDISIDVPIYLNVWELVEDAVCSASDLSQSSSSPHFLSWRRSAWFQPQQPTQIAATSKSQRTGRLASSELLYHLGGNGPWIRRITPGSPSNVPPRSCKVEQVHLLSRHGERYPTKSAGGRHLALVKRLKKLNTSLNGSLSFFNEWQYFSENPEQDFDELTSTGPYAGTLGSFTTGVRFRTRYGHLLPKIGETRLWASDSKRVIDTAKYFTVGFFGINWEKDGKAKLEVIPKTLERHTDTLTPGETCTHYVEDTILGHHYGKNMLEQFQTVYIPPIAYRLVNEEDNQGVGNFTNLEIYTMQEMCGFETIARGSSPWCDVLTGLDWDNFEYARDLLHFYRAGPGNKYAGAMGWLCLNATSKLLGAGPDVGTTFFSFAHDGDIAPVLTALDVFSDPKYESHLPVTHAAEDRVWRTSTVMTMGGRITFERLRCRTVESPEGVFVRININDDVIPLPDYQTGPGKSCPLDKFVERVSARRSQVGDFVDICGTDQEDTGLTFLRQPKV